MCFGLAKIGQKNIRATIFSTILSTMGKAVALNSLSGCIKAIKAIKGINAINAAAKGFKGFVISDKILIAFLHPRMR